MSALLAGLIIKVIADRCQPRAAAPLAITPREFLVGTALITLIIAPLTGWGLYQLAKASRATYTEHLHGFETAAVVEPITCERDGSCHWDYDCDPYIVMVPYEVCTSSPGPNNTTTTSCTTEYRAETRYHSCPYVTTEYSYVVASTLGPFVVDSHRFPADPDAHRWRSSVPVPDGVAQSAGVGEPPLWLAAKARLDAARPGPVTTTHQYDNYILASERTLLTQYSAQVAALRARRLLPDLRSDIYNLYRADQVHFVGAPPRDAQQWQVRLAYLNGALGRDLAGDLHVVVVRDSTAALQPDQYLFALKAHWQDAGRFGRDAFPKNAILLVVGSVDGARVSWARATTGMPVGNEAIEVAARQDLPGVALAADSVLGRLEAVLDRGAVHTTHPAPGRVETMLFGLTTPTTAFRRVSMSGGHADDVGTGFLYLKGEITPSRAGLVWTYVGATLLSCLVWIGMLLYGAPVPQRYLDPQGRLSQFRPTWRPTTSTLWR